ncbi:hypothetical protein [Proteus sp. G2673]|uniref:hypothetical protein n=1 Tax=Proteus sp. G2673 TaxID=2698885 RepID=UPI0013785DF6|nr:hypothetical protein [Proteus sp. G2673]NBL88863.1 hypothetical protein [Proteus sp. G2673]
MTDKNYDAHYKSDGSITSASLRDEFAMAAMNGILSNHCMIDNVTEQSVVWVAKESYLMADAMLKARG